MTAMAAEHGRAENQRYAPGVAKGLNLEPLAATYVQRVLSEAVMTHWRNTMVDRPETDAAVYVTGWTISGLARISHRVRRIGAPNQRKFFCEKDFGMIRGAPDADRV
jgi:hypothetical protein